MATLQTYVSQLKTEFPNLLVNDGNTEREMTAEEKELWYSEAAKFRVEQDKAAKEFQLKQSNKAALLDKLGITAEEAQLLLS